MVLLFEKCAEWPREGSPCRCGSSYGRVQPGVNTLLNSVGTVLCAEHIARCCGPDVLRGGCCGAAALRSGRCGAAALRGGCCGAAALWDCCSAERTRAQSARLR